MWTSPGITVWVAAGEGLQKGDGRRSSAVPAASLDSLDIVSWPEKSRVGPERRRTGEDDETTERRGSVTQRTHAWALFALIAHPTPANVRGRIAEIEKESKEE